MKVVYNWLKDFVDVTAAPDELASRLALSGTNIGGVEKGPHGAVIDAEVSSNRPDCLGHYGIAREVSAVYKLPLKTVSPKPVEGSTKASDAVSVEIQSPELCGRFTARVVRGVKIQPSPPWLRDRLEASGVASISNVVDISNYVMLELGHPLHTYDYDKVRDHRVIVRAKPGDAPVRPHQRKSQRSTASSAPSIPASASSPTVTVPAPSASAASWAAPTPKFPFSTKNILIECAWFEPVAVRRAARFLKLHTEASTRFGRGADPEMAELASRRAAELILQLAGGELLSGVVDVYPGKRAPKKIQLTRDGTSSRHGRRRSRQRNRSDPQRARLCSRSSRPKSRRGRLAARRLGMHAAFLARRSRARNRFDRRSRAHLRSGQISAAPARRAPGRARVCRTSNPSCASANASSVSAIAKF